MNRQEDPFLVEFIKRGGVSALAKVIRNSTGNTLAYALSAMQSVLELDYGYTDLDVEFVRNVSFATEESNSSKMLNASARLARLYPSSSRKHSSIFSAQLLSSHEG